jgi:hypothetical protein
LAYEEFVDFIAAGTTPQAIVDYKPSARTRERVGELVRRQKNGELSYDESAELNHYLEYEHLMRLAKARARLHLNAH